MLRSHIIIAVTIFVSINAHPQIPTKGDDLTAWKDGYLDLHHINTGRGNVAFYILPDGTSILFDAGEQNPRDSRVLSSRNTIPKPNDSKRTYEWIAHYIRQVAPAIRKPVIDYAILSHFHEDHMGSWYATAPKSAKGNYILTGITGVAELIPIEVLLDRGYPAYNIPFDMKGKEYEERSKTDSLQLRYWKTMNNYLEFVKQRDKEGMINGNIKAGSQSQIHLRYNGKQYPTFFVRSIKSNGFLWNGKDSGSTNLFPMYRPDSPATYPTENALSQVITINYGNFRYYTGGDIPGNVQYGQAKWMDMETPVSKVIGPVDVAVMDHHGNRDALNENMVRTFRPRVWIQQVWSSDHPGHEVLIRATTPHLYDGARDLFATNFLQSNRDVIGPLVDRSYKSTQRHILVRVLPGGSTYYVIILDDSVESLKVKNVFGPYESTKKQ